MADDLILRDALVNAFDRQGIKELASAISVPFDAEIPDGALKEQVFRLIGVVRNNGIDDLMALLDAAEKMRPRNQDLLDITAHLRAKTRLTFELRQQLKEIFKAEPLSPSETQRIFNAAWPREVVGQGNVTDPFEAAMRLAAVDPIVAGYPVLKFTELILAEWIKRSARGTGALQTWSDRAGGHFKLSQADFQKIRTDARQAAPTLNYLMIELKPSGGDEYVVSAHLWQGAAKGPDLSLDARPRKISEWAMALEEIIALARKGAGDIDFMLEFLVPIDLLTYPFESWEIAVSDFLTERVGVLFPVVVRVYERIYDIDPMPQGLDTHRSLWKQKWQQLLNGAGPNLHWENNANADPRTVYRAFINVNTHQCAGIGFPVDAGLCSRVARAVLSAGVPVMLWIRGCNCTNAQIQAEVLEAIQGATSVEQFPSLVKSYRARAPQAPDHPANNLTLVFDNADRVPRQARRLGIEIGN